MDSSVSNNLKEMFNSMADFIAKNTVVGKPITVDNVLIIPLVDICFGVGVGATQKEQLTDKAGGGMGAQITPNSLLVIKNGNSQIINIKNQESIGKLIDMIPSVIDKFTKDNIENSTSNGVV